MKLFLRAILMLLLGATTAIAQISSDATQTSSDTTQIPSNTTSSGDLSGSGHWEWEHDKGTPGTSVGHSSYPVGNPSIDGKAREFSVSYWHYGGELYHITFGNDRYATHFVYDTYIYLDDPSQVQNLEMDVNQVMSDGKTVIFGTQCSSISKTWDYAYETNNHPHWHGTNIPCNPRTWAPYKWHHVTIAMHRNSSGVVTHDWVKFDGATHYFSNATGPSALSLHWSEGELILNLQFDGENSGSGSIKGYVDEMNIQRW